MTPAARVAAAIDVVDAILDGAPAEKTLTTWGRQHRFAGSKDRAAIRDHVFDALRRLSSAAAAGGARTGRGILLGLLRQDGVDPAVIFTGDGHAPAQLDQGEGEPRTAERAEALDQQPWVLGHLDADLGADAGPVAEALRHRAPVFIRANLARTDRDTLVDRLAAEGVAAVPHPLARTALRIDSGARTLVRTASWEEGLFEMQDAASQAIVEAQAPGIEGAQVLDYCAGGGGKALALAALGARVTAHDSDPHRMADIAPRAARAGATVEVTPTVAPDRLFDMVLVDAPCSGSGAWRRQPEAKWRLTPQRLTDLTTLQTEILTRAASHVRPGGALVYATCSLFSVENDAVVEAYLTARLGWSQEQRIRLTPLDGGDGFFATRLRRPS